MKAIASTVITVAAALLLIAGCASADPGTEGKIDLTGNWEGNWNSGLGGGAVYLELEQKNHTVTGTINLYGAQTFGSSAKRLEGRVDGSTFTFSAEGSVCTINASLSFKMGKKYDTLSGSFSCTTSGVSMTLYRKK